MEWWLALTTLIIGAAGGYFIARSSDRNKKRADVLQGELDVVNSELNDYRGRVSQHFSRTAELVDALAANSREIYNHLAEGSQNLCGPDAVMIRRDGSTQLPAQSDPLPDAAVSDTETAPAAEKPDEGWYEILPEVEDRKVEEPVH